MSLIVPNFLIVGAAKAGTTSLHHYLKQHPDIFMPEEIKETFFFSGITRESFPGPGNNYGYRAISTLEDYMRLFNKAQTQKAIGEACVAYLYFHHAAIPKIVSTLGKDIKIVISLRHPADRAFSNYLHHVRDGLESLAFSEAIKAEPWRKQNGWWWGFEYVTVGFYADQVKAYLDAFGHEHVLILLYDNLVISPLDLMRTLFQFLDVDQPFLPNMSVKYNVSGIPQNRFLQQFLKKPHPIKKILRPFVPPRLRQRITANLKNRVSSKLVKPVFPPEVRRELIDIYYEDIQRLQSLIDLDLSHWLRK
jgi:hypothetical protein